MKVENKKTSNDLEVKPLPTDKTDLPQSPYAEKNIIAKFPSMTLVIGRSGSGKTTIVNYMLTQPNYLKDFFHEIYLFSPTAEIDDLAKHLKLKKENLVTDPTEEKLSDIIESQKNLVKKHGIKKVGKNKRVLIILDDIVSSVKFLKSPTMLKLATMARHYMISSFVSTQSYTKIPRAVRLQANGLILLPSSQDEVKLVCDDMAPPHCRKKYFLQLIEYATQNKHEFLYVNNFDTEHKFRKGFKEYLNMKPYKGKK